MSTSWSDVVTKFLHSFVLSFVHKFFFVLVSLKSIFGCFKDVSRVFQEKVTSYTGLIAAS